MATKKKSKKAPTRAPRAQAQSFPVKALLDARGRLIGVEVWTVSGVVPGADPDKHALDPGQELYPNEALANDAAKARGKGFFASATWVTGAPLKLLTWDAVPA
jgi:hypothetical protein